MQIDYYERDWKKGSKGTLTPATLKVILTSAKLQNRVLRDGIFLICFDIRTFLHSSYMNDAKNIYALTKGEFFNGKLIVHVLYFRGGPPHASYLKPYMEKNVGYLDLAKAEKYPKLIESVGHKEKTHLVDLEWISCLYVERLWEYKPECDRSEPSLSRRYLSYLFKEARKRGHILNNNFFVIITTKDSYSLVLEDACGYTTGEFTKKGELVIKIASELAESCAEEKEKDDEDEDSEKLQLQLEKGAIKIFPRQLSTLEVLGADDLLNLIFEDSEDADRLCSEITRLETKDSIFL